MKVPYNGAIVTEEMKRRVWAVMEKPSEYGGAETELFEVELGRLCARRYGVTANSGTSIIMMVLDALDIAPGDEIIMAANSYCGVLAPVSKMHATPVLVDVESDTGNISAEAAAAAVTPRTRMIIPTHMYGFPCNMDRLLQVAKKNDIFVLEDACHAMGAEYNGRPVGGLGNAGFFSFARKMINTFGPGGGLVTDERRLAEDISSLRDQGRVRVEGTSFARPNDESRHDQRLIGYNNHFGEMSAAAGRIQLQMLPGFVAHRRKSAEYYTRRFHDADIALELPPERSWANPCYLHYVVQTPKRDFLRSFLSDQGIETEIIYPFPLHLLDPIRRQYGMKEGQFPEAERLSRENLCLPVGPHVSSSMLEHVADTVIAFFERGSSAY